jgi:N utilization substance protein A
MPTKPKKKKKPAARKKPAPKKKVVVKKKAATAKKAAPKAKAMSKAKPKAKKPAPKSKAPKRGTRSGGKQEVTETLVAPRGRGLGSSSGGQSGDTQGLSRREQADSESVTELEEEGQYFEAEAVRGVENAPDADQGEVRTHEVPEDDVPEEYRDEKETDTD